MPNIESRISVLEKWAAAAAVRQRLYKPYSEICIKSISQDRACVRHHPKGNYGVTAELDEMTVSEAIDTACRMEGAVFVRMMFSPEWIHSFLITSDLYTPEQKQKLKEADILRWPNEISWLYQQEAPDRLISTIAAIPQNFCINGG